jgi:hypothetical protein
MSAEYFASGTVGQTTNTTRQIEQKFLTALNAGGGSGGGGGAGTGTFSGTGSPQNVVTASPGATYLDTSGGHFWAKQTGTGSSGWLELIV